MKHIVSRTLSVHKEHEVLLKLEAAGLNDAIAQRVIDSPGNILAKRLVLLIADEPKETILEQIGIVKVKGAAEFVAKEKFREGYTADGVSVAQLDEGFKASYLNMRELDIEQGQLKIYRLKRAARDSSMEGEAGIVSELSPNKSQVTLTYFFQLLAHKQQTKDFTGVVAYIWNPRSQFRAVDADWHAIFGFGGWDIGEHSILSKTRWNRGTQIVSL